MEKKNRSYNPTVAYLRFSDKGNLVSGKLSDKHVDALTHAQPGSKLLIRMLSDDAKAKMMEKNPDYGSPADAVLEIMTSESVAEFAAKNPRQTNNEDKF